MMNLLKDKIIIVENYVRLYKLFLNTSIKNTGINVSMVPCLHLKGNRSKETHQKEDSIK